MRPERSDRLQRLADALEPRFRRARFRRAVHYVCWICEDPRTLGLQRLNLILWYADRNLYLRRRRPLGGATYLRHHPGPRALPLEAQLRELERDGLIARRPRGSGTEADLLFALAPPDLGALDAEEVGELEAAMRGVCLDARATIPHRTAHDTIWRAALIGETLPYFTAYGGRSGDLYPADLQWAAREVNAGASTDTFRISGAEHPRGGEVIAALLWHLRREPAIGTSLPAVEGSWFVHKQAGIPEASIPEVTVVYRFELDELLPAAIRLGPVPDELDDET